MFNDIVALIAHNSVVLPLKEIDVMNVRWVLRILVIKSFMAHSSAIDSMIRIKFFNVSLIISPHSQEGYKREKQV